MDLAYLESFADLYRIGAIPFQLKSGVTPFLNYQKIHPLKHELVSEIVSRVSNCKIIIFGSATTGLCHIGSDLDVCIDCDTSDYNALAYLISSCSNGDIDILRYKDINSELLKNNVDKGVVVYDDITR